MTDFQEKIYKSSNASWVSLKRTRKVSSSEADLLAEVRHDWNGEGERKERNKDDKKKKKKREKPDPFRRAN